MGIRIQLSDQVKKFTFTLSSKELDVALSRVANVIASSGSNAKNFILMGTKGKVVLLAYNPDTFVYIVLPSGVANSDGAFGFTQVVLQGIIKSRGEMEFTFTGTECEFKVTKGRYDGKIVTLPITSDQIAIVNSTFAKKKGEDDESSSVLPRHVLDSLKEGVALTGIKDVYTGSAMLSYMTLSQKGILSVSAFDKHHFGHYKLKVDAGGITFRAALPSSHFLLIDKMVEGEEAKFYIRNENIKVEGENFALILPATQSEEKNFGLIEEYLKALAQATMQCTYDHDKFLMLTDNLFTLHSVNTSFEISHKAGSNALKVAFTTSNGSAQDSLKVTPITSADIKAKVDPRILKDVLGLLRGQANVNLTIVQDKVIRLDCQTKSTAKVSLVTALAD